MYQEATEGKVGPIQLAVEIQAQGATFQEATKRIGAFSLYIFVTLAFLDNLRT